MRMQQRSGLMENMGSDAVPGTHNHISEVIDTVSLQDECLEGSIGVEQRFYLKPRDIHVNRVEPPQDHCPIRIVPFQSVRCNAARALIG
jgi:hypothetical protein